MATEPLVVLAWDGANADRLLVLGPEDEDRRASEVDNVLSDCMPRLIHCSSPLGPLQLGVRDCTKGAADGKEGGRVDEIDELEDGQDSLRV